MKASYEWKHFPFIVNYGPVRAIPVWMILLAMSGGVMVVYLIH